MSPGPAFSGRPVGPRGGEHLVPLIAALCVVAFLGVAIAKPWDAALPPSPAAGPSALPDHPASPAASAVVALPAAGTPIAERSPFAGFTTPAIPRAGLWTALRWRRLEPADPLGLVRDVIRWRGGYVAVGQDDPPEAGGTPVWTSVDGSRWVPLPFGAVGSFWPGAVMLGMAAVPAGLVAITEESGEDCPVCSPLDGPVLAWSSGDGRTWRPHGVPSGWRPGPIGTGPLLAAGPSGVLLASAGPGSRLLNSADGARWRELPAEAFPAAVVLGDLVAAEGGYLAVGRWLGPSAGLAAALWSADGSRWSARPDLMPTSPVLVAGTGSTVDAVAVGSRGVIAVGHSVTVPGPALWWQSTGHGRWQVLEDYPPLGAWSPDGAAIRAGPHGILLADGERVVAIRGAPDAAAWVSADGAAWQAVTLSGDLPSEHVTDAALLPGGVLLVEGGTAWYGAAVGG